MGPVLAGADVVTGFTAMLLGSIDSCIQSCTNWAEYCSFIAIRWNVLSPSKKIKKA